MNFKPLLLLAMLLVASSRVLADGYGKKDNYEEEYEKDYYKKDYEKEYEKDYYKKHYDFGPSKKDKVIHVKPDLWGRAKGGVGGSNYEDDYGYGYGYGYGKNTKIAGKSHNKVYAYAKHPSITSTSAQDLYAAGDYGVKGWADHETVATMKQGYKHPRHAAKGTVWGDFSADKQAAGKLWAKGTSTIHPHYAATYNDIGGYVDGEDYVDMKLYGEAAAHMNY